MILLGKIKSYLIPSKKKFLDLSKFLVNKKNKNIQKILSLELLLSQDKNLM